MESRHLLAANLFITEFVANSDGSLLDGDEDTSDWLEIHNPSDQTVNLLGWSLSDDLAEPDKWRFPYTDIGPGEYRVIFASGKDRALDDQELRRDFHAVIDGTFVVDLPDGGYDVRVTMGGERVARDNVDVHIQGQLVDTVNTREGEYFAGTYAGDVAPEDGGQLAIRIHDTGGERARGAINAIIITPQAGGDPLRFDFGEADSPLAAGFTKVTEGDVYDAAIGYGWQAGSDVRDQDRGQLADELHTSFRLATEGEPLGLFGPDGAAVHAYDPQYPPQRQGASYGIEQVRTDTAVIAEGSTAHVLVPSVANGGDMLGTSWTAPDFDDSAWTSGPTGVGYERESTFDGLIATDLEPEMYNTNATAYVRLPFQLENAFRIFDLRLRMKYDDGFVAYLNGVEVARRNTPDELSWNSAAAAAHLDNQSVEFEDIDIGGHTGLLRDGLNVLAVHGMNVSQSSDRFLVIAELHAASSEPIVAETRGYFATPTPAAPNGADSLSALVAVPAVDVERGLFDAPFDTTLSTSTPGSTLVYTIDGSTPTLANGTQIPAPDDATAPAGVLHVETTTLLRVAAFQGDHVPSPVITHTYLFPGQVASQDFQSALDAGLPDVWITTPADYEIDPDVVGPNDLFGGEFASQFEDALRSVPTVSIVTDLGNLFDRVDGIYVNAQRKGALWERPTSVEILMPDNSDAMQVDAGIRIQGDNSRNHNNAKKHSFRLYFRQRYGNGKLEYALFSPDATDRFDQIVLRANYNDGWVHSPQTTQYIRDEWSRLTQLDMGQISAHGTWTHVYLNGFYWGLFNTIEHPEAGFTTAYFGGEKEDWDVFDTGVVVDGQPGTWGQFLTMTRDVHSEDQAVSNAGLQALMGNHPDGTDDPQRDVYLDAANYIDYLIMNFYGGNVDWPHRNWYSARRRDAESTGFKFFGWDTEKILNHGEGSHLNTNRTGENSGVAAAFSQLRANDEFRLMFADRVHKHFFNGGALYVDSENPQWDPDHPDRNVPAARYNRIAEEMELALIAESARWGDVDGGPRPSGELFTLHDWRAVRDDLYQNYFPQRSAIVLDQLVAAGLYPEVDAPVFSQHGGEVAEGLLLSMDAPGDIYFTLDGTDPRLATFGREAEGAAPAPTAQKYSGAVAIDGDTVVKARTLLDGRWSALNEAVFEAGPLPLRISEIMYHPSDPGAGSAFGDDDDFEFIEVVNVSRTATIDLEGVSFTDGISFTFPQMPLGPGEHAVVARHQGAFVERYGEGIPLAGQYGTPPDDFRLNNGGETLQLEDAEGDVLQVFDYSDDWYPTTDGQGYSLEMVDPASADLGRWGRADGWLPSLAAGGTPGGPRSSGPVTVGDLDLDGQIDRDDIAALVLGLKSPGDYASRYGVPAELAGDTDQDGDLDYDDIAGFMQRLAPPVAAAPAERAADAVFTGSLELPPARPGDWDGDGDVDFDDIARRPRSDAAPDRLLVRALKRR